MITPMDAKMLITFRKKLSEPQMITDATDYADVREIRQSAVQTFLH
jgi:hypothetical protein